MASKPKGFYSKGKVKSADAVDRAKARESLTTLKGIAGLVGSAVVEGIGGPVGKGARAAKVAAEGAEKLAPAAIKFAKRTGARVLQDRKGKQVIAEKVAQKNKISRVAARREAEKAAGPKAKSVGGSKVLKATAPKPYARVTTKSGSKTTVSKSSKPSLKKSNPVTVTRTTPRKAEDVRAERAKAKRDTLRTALTPLKPRGTKSGGKAIIGPKTNPRTVTVAKPGKATEINKLVNVTRTKKGSIEKPSKSIESRRVAAENASENAKNVSQPLRKTPAQRELEQRPDINRVGEVKAKDPAQYEADRRVAEGLKAEKKAPKNPPRVMKPRAPKYPKATIKRFKEQTGGN